MQIDEKNAEAFRESHCIHSGALEMSSGSGIGGGHEARLGEDRVCSRLDIIKKSAMTFIWTTWRAFLIKFQDIFFRGADRAQCQSTHFLSFFFFLLLLRILCLSTRLSCDFLAAR